MLSLLRLGMSFERSRDVSCFGLFWVKIKITQRFAEGQRFAEKKKNYAKIRGGAESSTAVVAQKEKLR